MAVTHPTAQRNVLSDASVDLLDGGVLRYLTSADVTIADGSFGTPAFGNAGAVNPGEAIANAIGDATNSTGSSQVVAKAALRSTTTDIVLCAVTATGGGGDIELTNTTVPDGEDIRTTELKYTSAP